MPPNPEYLKNGLWEPVGPATIYSEVPVITHSDVYICTLCNCACILIQTGGDECSNWSTMIFTGKFSQFKC